MAVSPPSEVRQRHAIVVEDPDLGAAVAPEQLTGLRIAALAPVEHVPPGAWLPPDPPEPATFGLLVLAGLAGLRVRVGKRSHLELLGPRDVLRPWVSLEGAATVPSSLEWVVLEPLRIAVLDRAFVRAVAPWPELLSVLADRAVVRARRLSFQLAVSGITGVGDRVALMLWHFADQWGQMTPGGVRLRLPLTHDQLSETVAAARPTVSSAIAELRRSGALSTNPGGEWLLRGSPPERFYDIRRQVALRPR